MTRIVDVQPDMGYVGLSEMRRIAGLGICIAATLRAYAITE